MPQIDIEKKNIRHSLNGDPPLVSPYARQKGEKLIKSMKTTLKKSLPSNLVTKSAYSESNLSNKFNIKSKIKKDHQHDVTYYVKCLEEASLQGKLHW